MERIKRVLGTVISNIYVFRVDYVRVLFFSKMFELLIVLPAISILFTLTLRLLGVHSLNEQNLLLIISHPLFLFMALLIMMILLLFIYYEMGLYMLLAYHQQRGIPYNLMQIWRRLNKKVIYFISLQSILLFLYILLLIPFVSTVLPISIIQNLTIPRFIVDELLASTTGELLYFSVLSVILIVNLRFIFTLPFFAINPSLTIWEAMKKSYAFSKRKLLETLGMLAFIMAVYATLLAIVLSVLFIPLLVVERVAPAFALITAAFTMTVVQAVLFLMFGLLQAIFAQLLILVAFRFTRKKQLKSYRKKFNKTMRQSIVIIGTFAFILWGVINYINLQKTIYEPDTKIIAHRGFMEYGVENTLSSFMASVEAGANMVEIDIQQTKDGKFVVFHDASLNRLAGIPKSVYNMTLAELQGITVTSGGLTDKIPSLAQMLEESNQSKVPLLIEVKRHGYETDDFLQRLIAEIDAYDGLDVHSIQALDLRLMQQVKELEPRMTVGSVHAVALGSLPQTDLDFIAIEQYFMTSALIEQAKAEKMEIFVWTVNTGRALQNYLVENVDGIITNYPDTAHLIRANLDKEKYFILRILNKINIIF